MSERPPLLVPLVTPFTDDTVSISEIRLAKLVRYHRDQGAKGFVVGSEIGEHLSLSHSERKDLLELVIREARGLAVVVNVTAFTTSNMLDLSQHAERHGAVAAVFRAPLSFNLTDEETKALATTMRRHSAIPVALIDTPERVALADAESDKRLHAAALVHAKEHEWSVSHLPLTCEFSCLFGVCSPLGVLGAQRAYRLFDRWNQAHAVAEGIWKLAGPIRFGRAVSALLDFETGHARPPVHELNVQGKAIMKRLWDASEPSPSH